MSRARNGFLPIRAGVDHFRDGGLVDEPLPRGIRGRSLAHSVERIRVDQLSTNGILEECSGERTATDDGCRRQLLGLLQVPSKVIRVTGRDIGQRFRRSEEPRQVTNRVAVEDERPALHVSGASLKVGVEKPGQRHHVGLAPRFDKIVSGQLGVKIVVQCGHPQRRFAVG